MSKKLELGMPVSVTGKNCKTEHRGKSGVLDGYDDRNYGSWLVVFEKNPRLSGWYEEDDLTPNTVYDPDDAPTLTKEWFENAKLSKRGQEVLIIRTDEIDRAKDFLSHFGIDFTKEKHGDGPEHWACEHDGKVLEIYPIGKKTAGLEYR